VGTAEVRKKVYRKGKKLEKICKKGTIKKESVRRTAFSRK
jgi:hypothetical protein